MKKKIKKPHKIHVYNIKNFEEYVSFCKYQARKGNMNLVKQAMKLYTKYYEQYRDEFMIPDMEEALGVKLERTGGVGRYGFYRVTGDVTTEQLEAEGCIDIRGKTAEEVTDELLIHDFLSKTEVYICPAEDD